MAMILPRHEPFKRETFRHKGKRWERIVAEPYRRFTMGVDLGQIAGLHGNLCTRSHRHADR